jgi:hypothetical protein
MNIARYSGVPKRKIHHALTAHHNFMLCNGNTIFFTLYLYILHIHNTNTVIKASNTVYRTYSFVFNHCATSWYVDDVSVQWTNVKVNNMGKCERSVPQNFMSWGVNSSLLQWGIWSNSKLSQLNPSQERKCTACTDRISFCKVVLPKFAKKWRIPSSVCG